MLLSQLPVRKWVQGMYYTAVIVAIGGIPAAEFISSECDGQSPTFLWLVLGHLKQEKTQSDGAPKQRCLFFSRACEGQFRLGFPNKKGTLFDLAIAVVLMGACEFFPHDALDEILFLGELSLNGVVMKQFGICAWPGKPRSYGLCGLSISEKHISKYLKILKFYRI